MSYISLCLKDKSEFVIKKKNYTGYVYNKSLIFHDHSLKKWCSHKKPKQQQQKISDFE